MIDRSCAGEHVVGGGPCLSYPPRIRCGACGAVRYCSSLHQVSGSIPPLCFPLNLCFFFLPGTAESTHFFLLWFPSSHPSKEGQKKKAERKEGRKEEKIEEQHSQNPTKLKI